MTIDTLQAAILFGLGGTLFLFERYSATRRMVVPLRYRWLTNISLALLGSLITGWVFSLDPLTVAQSFEGGLLGDTELPIAVEVIAVFLLLDFWRYWEHRVFHEIPLFWRIHLVHHSDTSIDITTTHRHHPLESLITTPLLLILLFAVGFSWLSFAVYVVIASTVALISHANVRLPQSLDALLRLVIVTPAVHAIHHSNHQPQTDSNYSSVLTLWDRIFGTYSDPQTTVIPHFGLDYFYKPADTILAPVLLQPFQYHTSLRQDRRQEAGPVESTRLSPSLSPACVKALKFGGTGVMLALIALWPIATNLAEIWNSSEAYLINWLVVPMFIYAMGWHLRDELLEAKPQPGYAGLSLILLGLIFWGAAEILNINLGRHLAFVVLLQGIAVCTLGFRLWWRYLPAFLMLFLMIPSGDVLQPVLRQLTTYLVQGSALIAGLPFRSEGFMVWVAEQRYIVVDACSGLSFVTLGLFMAYYFGVLLYRSLAKVLLLTFIGGCMGILANTIRVSTIIWLDYANGSQMPLSEHGSIAWMSLFFIMGLLLLLIEKLQPQKSSSSQRPLPAQASFPTQRAQYLAPVTMGVVLLCAANLPSALSAFGPAVYAAPSPLEQAMQTYPTSDWLIDESPSQKTLSLLLSDTMTVTIQEALDQHHLTSQPLKLGEGGEWRHQRSRHIERCSQQSCTHYALATWVKREQKQDYYQHLFYAYYVGDKVTDSVTQYRLSQAWNRITGNRIPHGLIGLMIQGDEPPVEQLIPLYDQFRRGQAYVHSPVDGDDTVEPTISALTH